MSNQNPILLLCDAREEDMIRSLTKRYGTTITPEGGNE